MAISTLIRHLDVICLFAADHQEDKGSVARRVNLCLERTYAVVMSDIDTDLLRLASGYMEIGRMS